MKDIKIDISTIDYTKPISYYSSVYGLSCNALRNRFKKMGIYQNFEFVGSNKTSSVKKILKEKEYNLQPKKCFVCNSKIPYQKRNNKFCSLTCSSKHSNENRSYVISKEQIDENRERTKKMWKQGRYDILKMEKVKLVCNVCKKDFLVYPYLSNRKFCSKECSSVGQNRKNSGGYRPTAGRGKSGWYKGYFCNSSWELAWVVYSLEHGVQFKRNTVGFEYEFQGKVHKYYPDFILEKDGFYVEVKGYQREQWISKKEQFPHKLQIIGKKEIVTYIDYVTKKYGKDFIKLYE